MQLNRIHVRTSFQVLATALRTTAVQSIFIQLISCVTAADEAPNSVSTTLFTAAICSVAFIDVCRKSQQQTLNLFAMLLLLMPYNH